MKTRMAAARKTAKVEKGHEPRWRRRKEARPQEILLAALNCFAERGFAATRIDDVAERAGVTKGTVYLYFPTKEELFKAVVREALVPNIARFEEMAKHAHEPADQVLKKLITTIPVVMASSPVGALPKLVISEVGNFPELAKFYLSEVVERAFSLIEKIIRRGIKEGQFRKVDTRYVIYTVIAPLLFALLYKHSLEPHSGSQIDLENLSRVHADMILHALARVD